MEPVPEKCPGTASEQAGKSEACAGCPNQKICSSGQARQPDPSLPAILDNLASIKHKIMVMSGKGGVGKSTVAAWLAQTLGQRKQTCILDVDLCGPSQARMMGCPDGARMHPSNTGLSPVLDNEHDVAVVSMAFLLDSTDCPVIWRGDRKTGMIRQLLRDVDFEGTEILIVDTPPGTSDEHLALVAMFKPCSAILVTTPHEVAWQDVRKQIDFCRKTGIPVIGLIENMTGGVKCEHCGMLNEDLFPECSNGMMTIEEYIQTEMGIPYLGNLQFDKHIAYACDQGLSISAVVGEETRALFESIVNKLSIE